MRKWILGVGFALAATAAVAQTQFCAGWEAGWKAAFETRHMLPAFTPFCPFPKLGQDSYAAGYERGLTAALGYIAQRGN